MPPAAARAARSGPDKALYVTDGPGGRVLRVDPDTGNELSFGATTTGVLVYPRLSRNDLGITFSGYDADFNEVRAVFEY